MASYLKFELKDGTTVFMEVADTPKSSGGLLPPARAGNPVEQSALSFDQSFDAVRKMASAMIQDLRGGFETEPEEVNISFALKASADANSLVISRGSVDANFGISVRWRNAKNEDQPEKKSEK